MREWVVSFARTRAPHPRPRYQRIKDRGCWGRQGYSGERQGF